MFAQASNIDASTEHRLKGLHADAIELPRSGMSVEGLARRVASRSGTSVEGLGRYLASPPRPHESPCRWATPGDVATPSEGRCLAHAHSTGETSPRLPANCGRRGEAEEKRRELQRERKRTRRKETATARKEAGKEARYKEGHKRRRRRRESSEPRVQLGLCSGAARCHPLLCPTGPMKCDGKCCDDGSARRRAARARQCSAELPSMAQRSSTCAFHSTSSLPTRSRPMARGGHPGSDGWVGSVGCGPPGGRPDGRQNGSERVVRSGNQLVCRMAVGRPDDRSGGRSSGQAVGRSGGRVGGSGRTDGRSVGPSGDQVVGRTGFQAAGLSDRSVGRLGRAVGSVGGGLRRAVGAEGAGDVETEKHCGCPQELLVGSNTDPPRIGHKLMQDVEIGPIPADPR